MYWFLVAVIFSLCADVSYSLPDCYGNAFDDKLVAFMGFYGGTFIEVGAHDGVSQSNTKRLEDVYGWSGILVEPSGVLFEKLCANRPRSKCFQCALGAFEEDGKEVYGDFDGSLMSSVHGSRLDGVASIKTPVRSLQSILDEVKVRHVHFFSLDTEGYEFNILKGIDFSRTTFDYLLIEIYTREYAQIVSLLASKGYAVVESFSNYNYESNPDWSGTHNDYLFKRTFPLLFLP